MLSRELRPVTWSEVAGQKDNVRLLRAIVKNPEKAPRCLILYGEFGTGKCVKKGTRVLTSEGYTRIEDLVQNPVFDEQGFMNIADKYIFTGGDFDHISHFYYGGLQKTITVRGKGFEITGTPNHRIMIKSEDNELIRWEKLCNLKCGQSVLIKMCRPKDFPFIDEGVELNQGSSFMNGKCFGYRSVGSLRNIPDWVFKTNGKFVAGVFAGFLDRWLAVSNKDSNTEWIFASGERVLIKEVWDALKLFGIKMELTDCDMVLRVSGEDLMKVKQFLEGDFSYAEIMRSEVFDEIFEITYGEDEVYDITVPSTHKFWAGGVVNHNTTCARILARELNGVKERDFDIVGSKFYYEFDSTVVGNVEEIRKMQDMFNYSYGDYWRVVVFDEAHSCSNAAQNALLKMLEENDSRTFFCFATTEVRKLLPTIRSRSLELQFSTVPTEDIISNLTKVGEGMNIVISEDIKSLIADRSAGHMRNAHLLLDRFLLLGEEEFKVSVKSAITLYCDFLIAAYNGDADRVLATINDLMNIPKDSLKSDWYKVMTESMKGFCGFDINHEDIKRLLFVYKRDFSWVISGFMSQWIRNAFIDMAYFQATFLHLYSVIKGNRMKEANQAAQTVQSSNGTPRGSRGAGLTRQF